MATIACASELRLACGHGLEDELESFATSSRFDSGGAATLANCVTPPAADLEHRARTIACQRGLFRLLRFGGDGPIW